MYIDAIQEKSKNLIRVVERRNGKREFIDVPIDHSFYVKDAKGTYNSIYGDSLKKIVPSSPDDFMKVRNSFPAKNVFEGNVNSIFRTLEHTYLNSEAPTPNVAFFDIETDFDKEFGYSDPADARNKILSIAVYLQWTEQMVCLALPPSHMDRAEAEEIAARVGETIIVSNEAEMLSLFLDIIEDSDIISGWHSESYDIPYTINRITHILGKSETRRMCLWDKMPRKRYIDRGGKQVQTYDLYGRVHSDYLQLYKKYNYEERHSYSLDNISKEELGEQKVPYDGTLDQLYNEDFEKFLEYNIQDTRLLDKLDKKLKFMELATAIAHSNCVLMTTAMGTVSMVEQAITIEAHRRNMIVPDAHLNNHKSHYDFGPNVRGDELTRAAGGWVSYRKTGLHKWIGSSDLASLYPSVIRALNMSPETIVGQLRTETTDRAINDYMASGVKSVTTFAAWWNDRFSTLEMEKYLAEDREEKLYLDLEDGQQFVITGAELKQLITEGAEGWSISANGTIFRNDIEGVVPGLLSRWYKERQDLQAIEHQFALIIAGEVKYPDGLETLAINNAQPHVSAIYDYRYDELKGALETNDTGVIEKYFHSVGLTVRDGIIVPANKEWEALWKDAKSYWNKQQLVKKILLNSAYGGLLNAHMKFFDQRIGQSTTLTGRSITKHMTAKTNELLTGTYDHDGTCILYNDTDSVYFTAWPEVMTDVEGGSMEWNKDIVAGLYDTVSDEVSETFPRYMHTVFNVPDSRGKVIKSAREIIATTALFIKKKRYAALLYDKDGHRVDNNELGGTIKAMGLDLRRSDTPVFMQNFLKEILIDVLHDAKEDDIITKIREFKIVFDEMKPWEKGSPKAVNNLTKYRDENEAYMAARLRPNAPEPTKPRIPGHVSAAWNWNDLREINKDYHSGKITDGQKIVVCYLLPNKYNITNIAYPTDELHLPEWFLELPFDNEKMRDGIVDRKIKNLLGVLKWDLSRTTKEAIHFESFFT